MLYGQETVAPHTVSRKSKNNFPLSSIIFQKIPQNYQQPLQKKSGWIIFAVPVIMRRYIQYILCPVSILMAIAVLYGCGNRGEEAAPAVETGTPEVEMHRLGFDPDTLSVLEGKVRRNEFFSSLLIRLGLEATEAYSLSVACDTVFDVRKLRSGNRFEAYYRISATDSSLAVRAGDAAGGRELKSIPKGMKPEYLVYERDAISDVVFSCRAPYRVWVSDRPVSVERRYAEVTITTSLWEDMLDAGVSPLLILQLSDIYAWTVDFFALQKEDSFRVLYDEKTCDGKVIAVDTVRYAVFRHGDNEFPAIMFNQGDGGNIYWNDKGESMRKQFLKAPLQYSRISSGFSYARRHPITRRVQPHTGVDYAAPAGTPVLSIGDGKVTSARNEGAGGNTVRIRHNSVYSTAYLHLSRFAPGIRAGVMVHQGDVIGYVGSTGRSTGPHLDFRVWKNGSPVNPLKMDSPPAEPLRQENMPAFRALADSLRRSF